MPLHTTHPVYLVARVMAWFGAAVLSLLALLSVVSIAGRALSGIGLGPVPGDFELVEAGAALAVFSFMPWAHLNRGHAAVDLLWRVYPAPMQRALEVFADTLMLVLWLLLTWRMGVAMIDYRSNAEVTFILQFPVWWGYAASMVPAALGCVVYAWRLLETLGLARAPAGFEPAQGAH
jgi:TRAP-type C4-dicarboxylate transport system permease small subunit